MDRGASENSKFLNFGRTVYIEIWHKPVKSCSNRRGLAQTEIPEQEEAAAVWHQCDGVG